MWYFLVRFILLIVAIVLIILCLRHIPRLQKGTYKKKIICFLASVAILFVILQYPFENLFFHFKTPEETFTYSYFGVGAAVQTIVEEDSCAFIVYSTGAPSADIDVIEKNSNGWVIRHPLSKHKSGYQHRITDDQKVFLVSWVQSKQSKQIFLMLHRFDSEGDPSEFAQIYDTLGSSFQLYTKRNSEIAYTEYYYTVLDVTDLDSNYRVFVDGKEIDPFKTLYQYDT